VKPEARLIATMPDHVVTGLQLPDRRDPGIGWRVGVDTVNSKPHEPVVPTPPDQGAAVGDGIQLAVPVSSSR
jgi:hypothetical protein